MNEAIRESLKSNYIFGNSCGFRKPEENKTEVLQESVPEGKLDFSSIAKQSALLNENEEPVNFDSISKERLYEKKFDLNPFKEDLDTWKNNINTKTNYTVETVEIKEDERTKGTKAVFTLNDEVSEKESDFIHEGFTDTMPDKIVDFISKNNLNFEFILNKKEVEFVIW